MTEVRDILHLVRNRAACMTWHRLAALGLQPNAAPFVAFRFDRADWAARWVGENISVEIECMTSGTTAVASHPEHLIDRIVHI